MARLRARRLRRRAAGRTCRGAPIAWTIVIKTCESCNEILAFVWRGGRARRYHPAGECARMERRLRRKT